MHRLASSLFALAIALTAALIPGAAVFAQTPSAAASCLEIRLDALAAAVPQFELIVIGTVHEENGGGGARLEPEAYLKGAASKPDINFVHPGNQAASSCELARLEEGARILVFLKSSNGQVEWPGATQVFWLKDGRAAGSAGNLTELELVSKVRAVTGQYAVPAASESEGAGIDWGKTVLPLSLALGVVFIIGLFLMRIWHRIDPS